jgi:hypothetical protein
MPQDVALPEPAMTVAREGGVVRQPCRQFMRIIDLAESLPVAKIGREVYTSDISVILNYVRTLEND